MNIQIKSNFDSHLKKYFSGKRCEKINQNLFICTKKKNYQVLKSKVLEVIKWLAIQLQANRIKHFLHGIVINADVQYNNNTKEVRVQE